MSRVEGCGCRISETRSQAQLRLPRLQFVAPGPEPRRNRLALKLQASWRQQKLPEASSARKRASLVIGRASTDSSPEPEEQIGILQAALDSGNAKRESRASAVPEVEPSESILQKAIDSNEAISGPLGYTPFEYITFGDNQLTHELSIEASSRRWMVLVPLEMLLDTAEESLLL